MQVLGLQLGLERDKMNRRQEKDTNMVHKRDKKKDMAHKRAPGMVTDMVPGMVRGIGKEHRLDMVPGMKKASELAPAPAQKWCIPLTAGRKTLYCLVANLSYFPSYSTHIH